MGCLRRRRVRERRKRAGQPVCQPCLSRCAGAIRVGRTQDRLASPAPGHRGCVRRAACRGAALRQIPQPGRICVRPRLGGGLRARRRALLSEAPGRRALHAGAGAAPAGAAGAACDGSARGLDLRADLSGREFRPVVPARDVRDPRGERSAGTGRVPDPPRRAISLGQPRLRRVRRFPRRAQFAQAQGDPQGARRRRRLWPRPSVPAKGRS